MFGVRVPLGLEFAVPDVLPNRRGDLPRIQDSDPEWRYFGTVNENYGIIQNTRLGELLDPLTERWPVETAGLLGKGETLFLVLDAGEADIDGDLIRQYFLISDTKNGKEALKAIFTPVRVVCQNTLVAGEDAAVAMRNFRHHKDIEKELGWHLNLLKDFEEVQERLMTDFRTLARAMLSDTEVWEIIEDTYPMPKKPAKVTLAENLQNQGIEAGDEFLADTINVTSQFEQLRQRTYARRDGAHRLAEATASERGRSDVSAWDVYQGIVEVEDYRGGRNAEITARSSLFGDRARTKARAFKVAKKAS